MRHQEEPTLERRYVAGAQAPAPDLCLDSQGEAIEGPKSRQSMVSMANTRQNLDDFSFTEVNSNIYQYRDRAAAVRAWHRMQATAAHCAGLIEIDDVQEGASVRATVRTEVSTTTPQFGYHGFALLQDVSIDIDAGEIQLDILGDQYASYRLAGTAILRVEIAVINGNRPGTIGAISRAYVDTMARVVGLRVERASLR